MACVCIVLAARLFWFIHRYAVNMMFWDQWGLWDGMFSGAGAWRLFTWQLGPHREGLGYLVIKLTAIASDWDTKTEAYVIGVLFLLSTALALAIKWRLTRRWSIFDVCIPLIILTLGNVEAYAGTTNPAHGPVPLLLILAIVLGRLLPLGFARAALTLVLQFFVVFSGFGLLFGPVGCALFLLDLAAAIRERKQIVPQALAFAGSIFVLALFFHGYVFEASVDCFVFPDPHPLRYVQFAAGMILRALQLHDLPKLRSLAAVGLVAVGVWLLAWSGWGTVKSLARSPVHGTVFALTAFSWLFIATTAVGRVCNGEGAAYGSRYVSYTLLMLLAGYLAAQGAAVSETTRTALLALCLLLFAVKEVRTRRSMGEAQWYRDRKQHWKDCYLRTLDVKTCDRQGMPVVPDETGLLIAPKLRYLREHHLNLFKRGE